MLFSSTTKLGEKYLKLYTYSETKIIWYMILEILYRVKDLIAAFSYDISDAIVKKNTKCKKYHFLVLGSLEIYLK